MYIFVYFYCLVSYYGHSFELLNWEEQTEKKNKTVEFRDLFNIYFTVKLMWNENVFLKNIMGCISVHNKIPQTG